MTTIDTYIKENTELLNESYGMSAHAKKLMKSVVTSVFASVDEATYKTLADSLTKEQSVKGKSLKYTYGDESVLDDEDTESYTRPNGDVYYARPWEHSGKSDVQIVKDCGDANLSVLMYGEPGTGKTALAEAAFGESLLTVLGTGDTEVADFVGGYTIDGKGGFMWVDGPLLTAMREGRPLLIDEIGIIDPKVMTVVYSVMDGRGELNVTANPELGTVKAEPGFYILAATNPNAPGVRLSEALLSRFTIHVEVGTDWTLAQKMRVPVRMLTVARNLTQKRQNGEIRWAPQMREALAFRDLALKFGQDFAVANLIASAPASDRAVIERVCNTTFGAAVSAAHI